MQIVINNITLDVKKSGIQASIHVKKGDIQSREIEITFRSNGSVYNVDNDTTAIIRAKKPDGTYIFNSAEVRDGKVYLLLTQQYAAVAGKYSAEVQLVKNINGTPKVLFSPAFKLYVENTIYDDSEIESTDEFTALTEAIVDAQTALEIAESLNLLVYLDDLETPGDNKHLYVLRDEDDRPVGFPLVYDVDEQMYIALRDPLVKELDPVTSPVYDDTDIRLLISKETIARQAADETLATKNELATQTLRIDNFVALPDGSTTADAELTDIRIDSIGSRYANAGNSVRGQILNVKDNIDIRTYGEIRLSSFVQGARNVSSINIVSENAARCTSSRVIQIKKDDIINVKGTFTGIKFALAGKFSDGTILDSGWKTSEYNYIAAKDVIFFVNVARTDGTSSIAPTDFQITITAKDKTSKIANLDGIYPIEVDENEKISCPGVVDLMGIRNLFIEFEKGTEIVQGSLQPTSKTITTSIVTGIACNVLIPCTPNEQIKIEVPATSITSNYKYRYGFYNAEKGYISHIEQTTDNIITIPTNTHYIMFGAYWYDDNWVLIEDKTFYEYLPTDTKVKLTYLSRHTSKIQDIEIALDNKMNIMNYTYVPRKGIDLLSGSLQCPSATVYPAETTAVGCITKLPLNTGKTIKVITPNLEQYGGELKYRYGYYSEDGTFINQVASTTSNKFTQTNVNGRFFTFGVFLANGSYEGNFYDLINDKEIYIEYLENPKLDYVASDEVEEIMNTSSSIITLNRNVKDDLLQAKRPVCNSYNGYLSATQPVVLLHFSDIHGDALETQRLLEFYKAYSKSIDDVICTGDIVKDRYSDGITWWTNIDNTEDILIAIGNHDALTASAPSYDWSQLATQTEQYNRYIAPFYSNWDIEITEGKTYYYKDYTDKKVRLIVLNCMLKDNDETDQLSWLETTLNDAITNDLSVIIANHYMIANAEKINCNFTNLDKSVSTDVLKEAYLIKIKDFINDGGSFICHIGGHTHNDFIVRGLSDYSNQWDIIVDASSFDQSNYYSDTQRTKGVKSQDLANLLVIDTSTKTVKLIRIGANKNHYLISKNNLTFNYETHDIITQN